ncbi:hypothetical protein GOD44_12585 [Sinorhizobium medicae]|nr:hypothetical protein [Sinorhizobium medicae]
MRLEAFFSAAILSFVSGSSGIAQDATGRISGTRCIKVTRDGKPDPSGTFVAQCSGRFPDFIAPQERIKEWSGQRFRLAPNVKRRWHGRALADNRIPHSFGR